MCFRKKLMVTLTLVLLVYATFCFELPYCKAETQEYGVVFEDGFEGDISSWYTYSYNGKSDFAQVESVAYDGNFSFMISSHSDNDARIVNKISVDPASYYTVSAYVKTEDVKKTSWFVERRGATISVLGTTFVSESVDGDTSWKKLEFSFVTGKEQYSVDICFTLGGYGYLNSGKVWFDNITVEKLSSMPKDAYVLDGSVVGESDNLLSDGDFEGDDTCWITYSYVDGASTFEIDDTVSRNGNKSMCITSVSDNDARIVQEVSVLPNRYYTVTAWAKVENVPSSTTTKPCYGATISVMDTTYVSNSSHGTSGWNKLVFSFYTAENQTSVELCFTLGGYGMMNSGKVWFDDITVKEVSSRPEQVYHLEYSGSDGLPTSGAHWAGYSLTDHPDIIKWTAFVFMWFVVIAAFVLVYAETGGIAGSDKKLARVFGFVMLISLIGRLIMGMFVPAFTYDIGLFFHWSGLAATDLFNIYSGENFLDYPPLYLYFLAPLGIPVNLLFKFMGGALSYCLLKLPSILADMVSAYILYRLADKYLDRKWAVYIGAFYLLNPTIWINSACWGQVDSLFTLLILFELYFIIEKRWAGAGIMFALMVLMKPHGIIFAPAIGLCLLFEIIKNKTVKPLLVSVGAGVAAGIVVVLPFYIRMGFENPKWLLELYMGTIGQYDYASMNAFNFYAMIGKNLAPASDMVLGLTFTQWGTVGICFAIILSIVFMATATRKNMKPEIKKAAPLIVSLVVLVTVFTFAHKMHERYMFAAIAICLFIFILTKERGFMYLAILFSVVIFINTYYIYNLNMMYVYNHPKPGDKLVMLFGGLEVASFAAMIAVTIKVAVKNKISKPQSLKNKINGEEK